MSERREEDGQDEDEILQAIIGRSYHRLGTLEFGDQDRQAADDMPEYRVVFSSETPVRQPFGLEVLVHTPEAADFSRLNDRGPVVDSHNIGSLDAQLGTVRRAWLENRRGVANFVFSTRARPQEIRRDIDAGVMPEVSVGYRINAAERRRAASPGEPDTIIVTSWEAFEISLLPVGADPTVGLGRAAAVAEQQRQLERNEAMPEQTATDAQAGGVVQTVPTSPAEAARGEAMVPADLNDAIRAGVQAALQNGGEAPMVRGATVTIGAQDQATADAISDERQRLAEIDAIARRFGGQVDAMEDLRSRAISEGRTVADFQGAVLAELEKRSGQTLRTEPAGGPIGMSRREVQGFSFVRLFRYMAEKQRGTIGGITADQCGLELEACRAFVQHSGQRSQHGGLVIPPDVMYSPNFVNVGPGRMARTLNTGTATGGAELVGTAHMPAMFVDVLRNSTIVGQMGATFLSDLTENVSIPKKTAEAPITWQDPEGATVAPSNLQTGAIPMSPSTAVGVADYTLQLLQQGSPDVENMVRMDLIDGIAVETDRASHYGSGAAGQPQGLVGLTGVNAFNWGAPNAPTWAELVDMETQVGQANAKAPAAGGRLGYVLGSDLIGYCKSTPKDAGSGQMLIDMNGNLNGYAPAESNQLPTGDAWFGNYGHLLIGLWGGLEVLTDPYSLSTSLKVQIVAHQMMDINARYPAAFTHASNL